MDGVVSSIVCYLLFVLLVYLLTCCLDVCVWELICCVWLFGCFLVVWFVWLDCLCYCLCLLCGFVVVICCNSVVLLFYWNLFVFLNDYSWVGLVVFLVFVFCGWFVMFVLLNWLLGLVLLVGLIGWCFWFAWFVCG